MKLEEWLQKQAMSAEEFAVRIDSDPSTIYKWLRRAVNPSYSKACKVQKATDGQVTIAELRDVYVEPRPTTKA